MFGGVPEKDELLKRLERGILFKRIPREVKNEWLEILKNGGLNEDEAENIIALIRGDPRLITGKPDEETIEIVRDILSKMKLGIEGEEEAKREMIRALENKIGEIGQKPVAVTMPAAGEKVPALYSPKISLIRDIVEPENTIILGILENNWEQIQKDFEENGLEFVLKKFAKAVVKTYEEILKLVILGNHDERSRERLYRGSDQGQG